MMEMDDRESAMCQNPREGTHWEVFKFLMIMRQKGIVYIFFLKEPKNVRERMRNGFTVA